MATQTAIDTSEPQYDEFFINDHSSENDVVDNTSTRGEIKVTVSISDASDVDDDMFQSSNETSMIDRETNELNRTPNASMPMVETLEDDAQEKSGLSPIIAGDENAPQSEQNSALDEDKTTTPRPNNEEIDDKTDFDPDDNDVQRDAANNVVALIVNVALAFFALMFVFAIVGSILLIANYGFITFVLLIILVGIVVSVSYLAARIIVDDQKLKPVTKEMRKWHAIAKAVVEQEVRNFQLDMREHQLLLTHKEGEEATEYEEFEDLEADMEKTEKSTTEKDVNEGQSNEKLPPKRSKGPRSMVFRVMVKPFLKEKNNKRSWLRRKKKQNVASDVNNTAGNYVPPVNEVS